MEKVEYWQTSFDSKINDSDAFLTNLCLKYCEQNNSALNVKKAVNFSNKVYNVLTLIKQFRSIMYKAEIDCGVLLGENKRYKERLRQFESEDEAMNKESLKHVSSDALKQLEEDYNKKLIEFKDKYQIQIQQLEMENDQLIKQLIKINRQ